MCIVNVEADQPFWSVLIRARERLPTPKLVTDSGKSLGKKFLKPGQVRVGKNDAMIRGWSRRRRCKIRAWVLVYNPETEMLANLFHIPGDQDCMERAIDSGRCRMPREFLKGSGDIAGAVRIVHALRNGMSIADLYEDY